MSAGVWDVFDPESPAERLATPRFKPSIEEDSGYATIFWLVLEATGLR